jgi:cysteine sulfinate desulfinase/cysteine desulfurase-like protein
LELFYKKPSSQARESMCRAAQEIGISNIRVDYVKEAERHIKSITGHEHAKVVNSGNSAIMAAMSNFNGPIILPDQGVWNGFKKIAEILGLEILYLHTNLGIIEIELLQDLILEKRPEALFLTSFAGYIAEQPVKEIYQICEDHGVFLVEDASGAVGDPSENLCSGKHAHILLASTGSPKIVNVGSGGFISCNDLNIFKNNIYLYKTLRPSTVTCAGMAEEIQRASKVFSRTVSACEFLKRELEFVLHSKKRGVNVCLPTEHPKSMASVLRKSLNVHGGGLITTCPRYDRVNLPAVCLEIKNLDTRCLDVDNLTEIASFVNKIIASNSQ